MDSGKSDCTETRALIGADTSQKIKLLSLVLSFAVILIHVTNLLVYGITSGPLYWIETAIQYASDYAVPVFFGISGYLFFRNCSPVTLYPKMRRRVRTLLVPYIIWGLFYTMVVAGMRYVPVIGRYINSDSDFVGAMLDIMVFGRHTHLWYIRNLMVYVALSPVVYAMLRRKGICLAYVAVVLAALGFGGLAGGLANVAQYSLYYLLGGWMATYHCAAAEMPYGAGHVRVCAGLLLLSVPLSLYAGLNGWTGVRAFMMLCAVPLIWVAADGLRRADIASKTVKLLSSSTFFIYVCHVFVLECVEKVIFMLLPHGELGAAVDYLIAPVVSMAVLVVVIRVLRRFPRLWSVINGGRG